MSAWELYWILRLDSICGVVNAFFWIFSICTAVTFLFILVMGAFVLEDGDADAEAAKHIKNITIRALIPLFLLASIFSFARALVPTTKQMAVIYVLPPVINSGLKSEKLKGLPSKFLNLADDWIDELSPGKSEQTKEEK